MLWSKLGQLYIGPSLAVRNKIVPIPRSVEDLLAEVGSNYPESVVDLGHLGQKRQLLCFNAQIGPQQGQLLCV